MLRQFHVLVHHEDIELAKASGLRISEFVRRAIHEYVNAPNTKQIAIEQLDKELRELDKELQDKNSRRQTVKTQLTLMRQTIEQQAKEENDAKKKKILEQEQCANCGIELTVNDHQFLKFGPHKGKRVCGSLSKGCVHKLLNTSKQQWWIMGPDADNENGTN